VFEDLKIKAMTASARGTAQAPGKRVAQKAGLNRSILDSAWGLAKTLTHYKARRHGKLCLAVAPHFSSQTCALCQHTHSDNRPSQSMFFCQHCEHTDNADINASRVTAQRGAAAVLAGEVVFKERKIAIKRTGRGGTPRTGGVKAAYVRGDRCQPSGGKPLDASVAET
jgi:putative transposase